MSKTPIEINKELFLQIIQDLENRETFANRSKLFEAVVADYNKLKADNLKAITPPIVYLRTNEWEVELKTPKGKRGRAKGSAAPVGFGQGRPRKNKAAFAKKYAANFEALRDDLKRQDQERFLPLVDAMERGSRKAGIKLHCLDCYGYSTGEVRRCQSITCAMHPFRPYQRAEETDTEVPNEEQTKEAA